MAWLCCAACSGPRPPPGGTGAEAIAGPPRLRPPVHGITIPPNLCPLTFTVDEPGVAYAVRFEAAAGQACEVTAKDGRIRVPPRRWEALLQAAAGGDLMIRVSVRDAVGAWRTFAPAVVHVSGDPIDGYLVYRRILPLYNFWHDVGIYQRALTGWQETEVLHGRNFAYGCTNCHAFAQASPALMSVGTRSQAYGSATLLYRDGAVTKLASKWGYTSWHPSGKLAAYSLNRVQQFFHTIGPEVRDVCDLDSDIAVYYPDGNRVVTAPGIADPDYLETYPAWSADGRELYFCRAPITWTDRSQVPPPGYQTLRYSLAKVTFDPETAAFGDPQTVLAADAVGQSVMLPRPSPDGRFLVVCLCDYGCFPIYQPSSDLYMIDLATGSRRRLDLNSTQSESWHSWSSTGRWLAFSSKRGGGLFTRTYLAHVDPQGNVGEPFVLPQADPAYYDSCLETFSVPEFLTARLRVSPRSLAAAARRADAVKVTSPPMSMTATPSTPPRGLHPGDWSEAPPSAHQ